MTRGILALLITVSAVLAILYSCANIKPPTGGIKDTIPPLIIETEPLSQSLNFKGEKVMLKFHEPIIVDNLNKKLIITPRFEEFKYKATKYEIFVTLEEPLSDSTTYTFNFTDGIKDLNEGNIARDVSLAFSTGTYIDSVTLVGKVVNLLTNEEIEESVVALYGLEDTVDLFTGKPMYYARTNKKGIFKFQNLRNEQYQLYAYNDNNNDLLADSRSEEYGFFSAPVTPALQQPEDTLIVPISLLNILDLELISSRPFQLYYDIKFIKSIVDFELTLQDTTKVRREAFKLDSLDQLPLDTTLVKDSDEPAFIPGQLWDRKDLTIYGDYLPGQNLIRIFQTFPIQDSIAFHLWAIDSVGFQMDTTLSLKFRPSNRAPLPFVTNFDPPDNQPQDLNFIGTYRFTKPIGPARYDSILLEYDSLTSSPFVMDTEVQWNPSRTQLTLTKAIDQEIIDRLIAEQEAASLFAEEQLQRQKFLKDSLRDVETDSIRKAMDSLGTSNTSKIDSLRSIKIAYDSGTMNIDSTAAALLTFTIDSLVKTDKLLVEKLRPKPPLPDTLQIDSTLTVLDSAKTDSSLVALDTLETTSDKKPKKKKLKLNLPKKKPKEIKVEKIEEPKKPIPPGGFRVSIPSASFISVEGDTTGSISRNYTLKATDKFGIIRGQIVTEQSQFIIQLLDKYYDLVLEQHNTKQYEFNNIPPGDYFVRVLVDLNQNGQWDPGNVLELIEPEPVIFYPQSIPVKENWELENDIITF